MEKFLVIKSEGAIHCFGGETSIKSFVFPGPGFEPGFSALQLDTLNSIPQGKIKDILL